MYRGYDLKIDRPWILPFFRLDSNFEEPEQSKARYCQSKGLLVGRLKKKETNYDIHQIITYFQLLHLKLFLILGLLWTMESVHFIIHTYGELCDTFVGLDIFFRVIDCFNILRGFFFLIIFVCNKITLVKISQFWYVRYNPESDKERSVDTIF